MGSVFWRHIWTRLETKTIQILRLRLQHSLDFDWSSQTEPIRKSSKICQKLIKNFGNGNVIFTVNTNNTNKYKFMANVDFRTRGLEKQGFEEKEELKSKLESSMEEKFKLEKVTERLLKLFWNIVEAPVSGHPREAEKVSATGAGRLRECVNTEFVWARIQNWKVIRTNNRN